MVMNIDFWRKKKVFVTGHTGFKGSWLSLWLQHLQAQTTGYALAPHTRPSLFELAQIDQQMNSIIADITDLNTLTKAIQESQPEIVFHMAAQSLVQYSYQHPVETYATNVMGTVHLLEAVRQCSSVKVVIIITSDKCYENKGYEWNYQEHEPMGGYDPYSNSKGCAELVTAAYRSSFFNPHDFTQHGKALASVRAGNVIGGGDWAQNRLIPDVINALIKNEPIIIRSPDAIRPWQHVLEPLAGYLQLAEKLWHDPTAYAEGWNFGPHEHDVKPVRWIVDHLTRRWGNNASWVLDQNQHPHEAKYLKLDISKVKQRLQWQPQMNLENALDLITDWYKAWQQQQDVRQITLTQIQNMQQKLGA
jgi:CDP-glucose 4,6-dehydratase